MRGAPAWKSPFPFDGKDGPGISLVELKRDADAGKTLAEIIEALSIGDASTLPPYVEEAGGDDADAGQVEAPASPPSVADVTLEALRLAAERIEMNNYGGEEDEALVIIRAAIAAAQGKEG